MQQHNLQQEVPAGQYTEDRSLAGQGFFKVAAAATLGRHMSFQAHRNDFHAAASCFNSRQVKLLVLLWVHERSIKHKQACVAVVRELRASIDCARNACKYSSTSQLVASKSEGLGVNHECHGHMQDHASISSLLPTPQMQYV